MANLNGIDYTREQLLQYAGNMSQIAAIEPVELLSGKKRGMQAYRVKTPAGLAFDILPDKCLDIGSLSYKGINISYITKNGISAPGYAYPVTGEFDRYFSGGMLMTCGLKNTGTDFTDESGHYQQLHGRLSNIPCELSSYDARWQNNEYIISAKGIVHDSQLEAHHLTLERTIETSAFEAAINFTDIISNEEPTPQDYLILYHINFGWPFISPDVVIRLPEKTKDTIPRTKHAQDEAQNMLLFTPPKASSEETVYFHHPKPSSNKICEAFIENKALGIGCRIAYENTHLPILTQWNSLQSGEYVLGIEPGNSYIGGMDESQKSGCYGTLQGFEQHTLRYSLGFYCL